MRPCLSSFASARAGLKRQRPSYIPILCAAALALFFYAAISPAVAASPQTFGNSTTLAAFHEEQIDGDWRSLLALYEFLDAGAKNAGASGLDLYFSGWGRLDTLDSEALDRKQRSDAELESAYLGWSNQENWLNAWAGRRFVHVGPVAERIDGAQVQAQPLTWLGVQGFGGVPAVSRVGERDGDYGYGGRLYGLWPSLFEVGVSWAEFIEKSDPDRVRMGGDLRVFPHRSIDVFGHAYYDPLYRAWYDAKAAAIARPAQDLELYASYDRVVPSAFLGMSSIFSVFTRETVNTLTARAHYAARERVVVKAQYNRYDYAERDGADRIGGSAGLLWGKSRANSLTAGLFLLDRHGDTGYWEIRASAFQAIAGTFHLAADGSAVLGDDEADEDRSSYASVSFGWNPTGAVGVQASGIYLDSDLYNERLRGMLRFSYAFGGPM